MRKNIKKIIAVITMTVSIFTLIGCGQTNNELKEEIKQEIKSEDDNTKPTVEIKETTKGNLAEFEKGYNEYNKSTINITNFTLPSTSKEYITLEKGKELKAQSDAFRDKIIATSPKELKETIESLTNEYDNYFKMCEEGNQSKVSTDFGDKMNTYNKTIKDSLAELHTQLDK